MHNSYAVYLIVCKNKKVSIKVLFREICKNALEYKFETIKIIWNHVQLEELVANFSLLFF